MNPKEVLKGSRIKLERARQTFEEAYERYTIVDNNRDHILPWLDWAMPSITKAPEDCYAFLIGANKGWDDGDKYEYTIKENASDKIIGGLGVMKRGRTLDKHFEIGFWLAKDACSKGYMQEAVKLVEDEFFALGIKRLVICNEVKNIKSRNVGLSLGYEFEGMKKSSRYSESLEDFMDINVYAKIF
ncbi:MAG: GNAT family protein [Alphaproteobacteria bacterium]